MFYYDYYLYMIPAFLVMLITQWYVSSAYKKWSKVPNHLRITGLEAAERLIRAAGLYDIHIERVEGKLSDHYDPRKKILRLSANVSDTASVSSMAIAAHELGHAMQDQENYAPLKLRAALVPAVNIGSYLGWILILIGLLLRMIDLAWLGLLVFSGGAVFALATLPVELNASARARLLLTETGLITDEEESRGVRNVLTAASLTYVAALVTAIMQLLYFASMISGRRR
jgi:hypothetical protein